MGNNKLPMKRALLLVGAILAAVAIFFLTRGGTSQSESERNEAFTRRMSGVTLVGNSTMDNRDGISGPERYHIDSIAHVAGDTWLFRTRLNYSGKEIPVPIPLTVRWAGDTPVITLTDLAIPGVGTFTARIVLYRDRYAGTWSAQKGGGGQIFGKLVRGEAP